MKQNSNKLSRFEAFSLGCVLLLFGICDDSIPRLGHAAGGAGWISQILCFVLIWLVYELFAALLRMYGGKPLTDILRQVYGSFISKIILLCLLAVLLAVFALILRNTARFVAAYAYTQSRSIGVTVLFAAVAFLAALYPFRGLARVISFCFFPAFAAILLILVFSSGQYDVHLLAPALGYGAAPVIEGGFSLFGAFIPFFVVTLFAGHFDGEANFSHAIRRGICFSGAVSVAATLCYSMAVPYHTRQTPPSGILELGRRAYISRFLQRFEPLFLLLLCIGLLAVAAAGVFSLKTVSAHLLGLKSKRLAPLALCCASAVLFTSLWLAQNAALCESLSLIFERYGFAVCFGFILLTLTIAWLRQKKRRPPKAAALLLALLFLTSCRSYREPDEELAALLIGYDKGQSEKYKITFTLMPEAGKEAAPSGDENGGANVFSVEADSSLAATDMLGAISPKRISLLHTRAIVISEELARDGIAEILAPVSLYGEIRSNATVIVSQCPAEEYLRAPELAISPSLPMTLEMLLQKNHGTSAFGFMTISRFLNDIRSEYGGAITPLAKLAGDLPIEGAYEKELAGMALFNGDKLAGTLDYRETASWQMLSGTMKGASYTVEDPANPQQYVSFIANAPGKPKVEMDFGADGKAKIKLTAKLNLRTAVAQNQNADYTDPQERESLRVYTKAQIERELIALVRKTQTLGCDFLQLGRHCAGKFLTIQEWRAYNWSAKYPDAEITAICDLSID